MTKNMSKQLERVDLNIVERILFSLIQNGSEKKTVLARRINRNYDYFIRYLEFLELLGFVNRETSTDTQIISVSDSGKFFYLHRFSNVEKNLI
jgi:predicted transcriptional regulator